MKGEIDKCIFIVDNLLITRIFINFVTLLLEIYDMKRNWILILLILLPSVQKLFSQELSHQVLVPFAGITDTPALEYTQTAGEAAVITISTVDLVLTQGFQQPRIIFKNPVAPQGNGVKVYPNPVRDEIIVELFGDVSRSFRIEIINISGVSVIAEKVDYEDLFWQVKKYPAGQLKRGFYLVRVYSDDGLINRTFKIEKL